MVLYIRNAKKCDKEGIYLVYLMYCYVISKSLHPTTTLHKRKQWNLPIDACILNVHDCLGLVCFIQRWGYMFYIVVDLLLCFFGLHGVQQTQYTIDNLQGKQQWNKSQFSNWNLPNTAVILFLWTVCLFSKGIDKREWTGLLPQIFHSLQIQFLCCGYSKESSHWDDSFEYSQHRVWMSIKDIRPWKNAP